MATPRDDAYYAKRDAELAAMFNDPANRKFDKIWVKEADIAEDLLRACNWYNSWSQRRDAFAAENEENGVKNSESMIEWWDEKLVKVVGNMARLDEKLDQSQDALAQEFNKRSMSLLTDIRELLAELDDTQIKSGKAIFDALRPILTEEAAPAEKPKAPEKGPLDDGNPFKKGPKA